MCRTCAVAAAKGHDGAIFRSHNGKPEYVKLAQNPAGAIPSPEVPPTPRKGAPRTPEAKERQTAALEKKNDQAIALLPAEFVEDVQKALATYGQSAVSPESILRSAGAEVTVRKALADAGMKSQGTNDQLAVIRLSGPP